MLRYLTSLGVSGSNTVLKTSARYVRLSAQRFKDVSPSKMKFKIGGVEKLKGLLPCLYLFSSLYIIPYILYSIL